MVFSNVLWSAIAYKNTNKIASAAASIKPFSAVVTIVFSKLLIMYKSIVGINANNNNIIHIIVDCLKFSLNSLK